MIGDGFFSGVVPHLLPALQHNDVEIRRNSALLLATVLPGLFKAIQDGVIAEPYYIVAWDHTDRSNKAIIINPAVKILRKAQKDRDEYVRNCTTWTFNQIKEYY